MTEMVTQGSASLILDGGTVRSFRVGGVDVVQSLGIRFRDPAWNTAPNVVGSQTIDREGSTTRVETVGRSVLGDIDCTWTWILEVTGGGNLHATFRATAMRDFEYARIGHVTMLTPDTYVGARCVSTLGGTSRTEFTFPPTVAAQVMIDGVDHPPFPRHDVLDVETPSGRLRVNSIGGDMEMEDQRNWTDHSFKLYDTGPETTDTLTAVAGEVFERAVAFVWTSTEPPSESGLPTGGPSTLTLRPGGPELPRLGTTFPTHPFQVSDRDLDGLDLDRLRFDLFADDLEPSSQRIEQVLDLAGRLRTRIWLVVHFPHDRDPHDFASRVFSHSSLIGQTEALLVVGDDLITREVQVDAVRRSCSETGVQVPVFVGSDAHFMELNAMTSIPSGEGVAWPMSPQMHEQDDTTVLINSAGQRAAVLTVEERWSDRRVWVSPVTLRPRFNSEQVKADGRHPGPAPAETDPRQHTGFAAAWTVGSLADLYGSSVEAIDYFELAGPAGILGSDGEETPLGRLFKVLSAARSRPSLICDVDSDGIAAIGWIDDDCQHALAANLSGTERDLRVAGEGVTEEVISLSALGVVRLEIRSGQVGVFPLSSTERE